jgi:hypothetical protein
MFLIISVRHEIVKRDQHLSALSALSALTALTALTEGLSRCASSDPMPLRGLRWKWANASPYSCRGAQGAVR